MRVSSSAERASSQGNHVIQFINVPDDVRLLVRYWRHGDKMGLCKY